MPRFGQITPREDEGVFKFVVEGIPCGGSVLAQQREIVAGDVVSHEHRAARKLVKVRQHFFECGHSAHHVVGDRRLFRHLVGNVALGIEQRGESFRHLAVLYFRRADLDRFDGGDVQSRSLEVEHHERLALEIFRHGLLLPVVEKALFHFRLGVRHGLEHRISGRHRFRRRSLNG